ncbi:hypothetical protein VP01_1506g3 [Puccinia sorghi]|uniref:DDE Tnp4 domain-containing protein n=1 Tax=Puccinia sorghi TaxID=27349 RepID=A0A0L6VJ58_9BASI|nr:hypothetical protein VP01_1506g3 [Puccinia sorghi]
MLTWINQTKSNCIQDCLELMEYPSHNVLVICNFNMELTYVRPGGKVVAWGFWITSHFFVFNPLLRNHISPEGLVFNLGIKVAFNVVERIFGVIRSRFIVISHGCKYSIELQVKVVILIKFLLRGYKY